MFGRRSADRVEGGDTREDSNNPDIWTRQEQEREGQWGALFGSREYTVSIPTYHSPDIRTVDIADLDALQAESIFDYYTNLVSLYDTAIAKLDARIAKTDSDTRFSAKAKQACRTAVEPYRNSLQRGREAAQVGVVARATEARAVYSRRLASHQNAKTVAETGIRAYESRIAKLPPENK